MPDRPSDNLLSRETSPYLLQHADNPVHWRAWGPEALREARQTGSPVLRVRGLCSSARNSPLPLSLKPSM